MITAFACYNDLTAIGALRALRHAGVPVPAGVSVIGFDDIEMAAWTDPPLTTVRQPAAELGRWALDRVVAELSGGAAYRSTHGNEHPTELEPILVDRASTGPPPT